MLDKDTVIRFPHAAVPAASRRAKITDPRASVEVQDEGAAVTLFFDPERAFAGDAELLEIRLTPLPGGQFEPWRLIPQLPLRVQYARASLAHDKGNVRAALRAMQKVNAPRRGLRDDFLRLVAETYTSLVAEGEPYPVKALAGMENVDISTASRWISTARARGFLPAKEDQR